ncbi:hypothetical protein Fmac_007846 [Flemingia macrophylla]|uniref:Subtilisin-like protease n=1 Tax=Flemingia macrophylla TaxID=520843 RepID=A0ABD1MVS2_9FABA
MLSSRRKNNLSVTYVVYMGAHSHGPDPSPSDLETATNSHHDLLASVLGSDEMAKEAMMYSYNKHINGFAALLEEEEASMIAKNPNVVSIFLSKEHKLLTTRSWDFLGLHEKNGRVPENSAWAEAKFGENIIIANIDSGVWPEHPSFSDKGYGPIPSKWRGNGVCQIHPYNTTNKNFCNRKLIGAKVFLKNYEAQVETVDGRHRSARDFVGHGSHTLSTAGGNFVGGAQVEGNGNGTAKGGSPRARVVAYKACWDELDAGGCQDADIIEAFDHAIHDGVDVISLSLGSSEPYSEALFTDGNSIGSFHAVANNIVVVSSAGNDGPAPRSVTNVAPWAFTVAASTMDRDFLSKISLVNNQSITGASINKGLPSSSSPNKLYQMINSVDARRRNVPIDDARLCKPGTIDPKKVKGKILVCLRGDKLTAAKEPDLTAPGVSIIAAFSQAAGPSNLEEDKRRVLFNLLQGTSMACPHVAGVAGLVKSYHPDWSPAAIKSAIMTTATTLDNTNEPIKNAFDKVATPFEYGAGHIQPNSSLHPGLVYDLKTTDYLNFLCASNYDQALIKLFGSLNFTYTCPKSSRIEDLNYPSITVHPPVSKPVVVTRTVTNVGPPGTYVVNTRWPKGIKVIVQPSSLTFNKTGDTKRFQVILKTIGVSRREFPSFGSLSWTDGRHTVTSPIVVLEQDT